MTTPHNATSGNKNRSKKFIKSFMKIKKTTHALLKRVKNDCCSICMNDFSVDERVYFLKCTHIFHKNCIIEWLFKKNMCHLCCCKLYENDDHVDMDTYTDTDTNSNTVNMKSYYTDLYIYDSYINFWTISTGPLVDYGRRRGFMRM